MIEKRQSLFRTFASGSLVIMGSNALTQVVSLLATLLILRYASVYDYGLWRLILSILGIFELATFPGLDTVLIADAGRELGAGNISVYKGMLRKTIIVYITFGMAAAVILAATAPLVSLVTHIHLTIFLWTIALSIVAASIVRAYTIAFSTQLRFGYIQFMTFLNSFFYLASLSLFLYFGTLRLEGIIISYAVATLVPAITFLPIFLRSFASFGTVTATPYRLWQTVRSHGKWSIVLDYANELSNFLKPWVLGFFLGIEAVGIFSAATSMLSAIANFVPLNQILGSVLPRESQDRDKMGAVFVRTLKYWVWFYAIFALATLVIAPWLVPLLFPKYVAAIPLLLIMLISLFATAVSNATSQALNAFRRQRDLLVSTVAPRVLSIFAVLPALLSWLGIYGAAIDQILTSYGSAAMRERYIGDLPEFKIPWRSFFTVDVWDRQTLARVWSGFLYRVPGARLKQ